MTCELCHKSEAETVVHVKQDDVEKELFVCRKCAAEFEKDGKDGTAENEKSGGEDKGKEIAEGLLKATIGLIGMAEKMKSNMDVKCPDCGKTFMEIREEKRMGCPTCWKTFAKYMRPEFLRNQYSSHHVGARPTYVKSRNARQDLEKELRTAVEREDFETAAKIRRRLDEMEKDAK